MSRRRSDGVEFWIRNFLRGLIFSFNFSDRRQIPLKLSEIAAVEPEKIAVEELSLIRNRRPVANRRHGKLKRKKTDALEPDGYFYIIGKVKGFEDVTHFCVTSVDYAKSVGRK